MFALIDCNCFYVSCERLFSPSLEGRAVAILSGPEGCIVSCSPEMKLLGARVGDPWFIAKKLPGMHLAAAFTANFELYGDMSRRVMQTLARFGLPMEVYSIDEAFVGLPASMDAEARLSWARRASADCLACGIPVSIGIGSTKTRAKLANSWAKPSHGGSGHCDWDGLAESERSCLMTSSPCSDVWGVGPKSFDKLAAVGIHSVYDLSVADTDHLRNIGTVTLSRCGAELRGDIVHTLVTKPAPAQSIMRTRTFDRPVPTHKELSEAIAHFASAATFHLRAGGLLALQGEVFIGTHPMDRRNPPRSASMRFRLPTPSDDALVFGAAACAALGLCFKPGYAYRRAGITLSSISANPDMKSRDAFKQDAPQPIPCIRSEQDAVALGLGLPLPLKASLDALPAKHGRAALMAVMDQINAKHGRNSIKPAAARLPSQRNPLPCPTTRLMDVPVAKAV
jgi:DNA polymerase V